MATLAQSHRRECGEVRCLHMPLFVSDPGGATDLEAFEASQWGLFAGKEKAPPPPGRRSWHFDLRLPQGKHPVSRGRKIVDGQLPQPCPTLAAHIFHHIPRNKEFEVKLTAAPERSPYLFFDTLTTIGELWPHHSA
jgi:hypothetical protein